MAKKVKRKVSQVVKPAPSPDVAEVETVTSPTASPRSSFSRRTATTTEFNPDYSYVVSDLKRIGVLAGTFFVILIALSFIIR